MEVIIENKRIDVQLARGAQIVSSLPVLSDIEPSLWQNLEFFVFILYF